MEDYLNKAMEIGFSKAVYLHDISIECLPEIRAYCNPEQCTKHGQNWVCPPGCGTIEECSEKALQFHKGLLLQSVTELDPPTEPEAYLDLNRKHNFRFKEYIEIINSEFTEILPLTTGGCIFCEQCSYPEPCIKPDVKMESLSAFGIDVGKLCKSAGLPYSFTPDFVYYTALLLLK